MRKLYSIVYFLCCFFLFAGCKDDVEIETGEASNITYHGAEVTCRIVSSDVSLANAECGVLYSTSGADVESGAGFEAKSVDFNGETFTAMLSFTTADDFSKPGTKYFYCGYVRVNNNWYYGNVRSLRTGQKE